MQITEPSRRLRQIAARLVESCPPAFGQEVMLIGSAGWGNADGASDIDLDFWVEKIPPAESVKAWLQESEITLLGDEEEVRTEEGLHLIGRWQDTWVECTWFSSAWRSKVFQEILAGETLDRIKLSHAWNLTAGLPLRTHGLVDHWRQKLAEYPQPLQERLIHASSEFWLYPHHLETLWTLALRGELMGLNEWLSADLEDGLRILFAANRQWEPDWKSLTAASELLHQKPDRLCERVNAIYLTSQPEEQVELLLRLLADILALVPQPFDLSRVKVNIEASLLSHCP